MTTEKESSATPLLDNEKDIKIHILSHPSSGASGASTSVSHPSEASTSELQPWGTYKGYRPNPGDWVLSWVPWLYGTVLFLYDVTDNESVKTQELSTSDIVYIYTIYVVIVWSIITWCILYFYYVLINKIIPFVSCCNCCNIAVTRILNIVYCTSLQCAQACLKNVNEKYHNQHVEAKIKLQKAWIIRRFISILLVSILTSVLISKEARTTVDTWTLLAYLIFEAFTFGLDLYDMDNATCDRYCRCDSMRMANIKFL